MRRPILHVAIVLVLFSSVQVHGQDAVYSVFAKYLEALRVQAGIPGMVAEIIGPQQVLWSRPFGQQDVEHALPTRVDTPFHVDGLTQIFTASLILSCVEQGQLSLDTRVGVYEPDSPDANATIRQVLTHTSGPPDNLTFSYNPPRLDSLAYVMAACAGESSREMLSKQVLERFAMIDSVPGVDAVDLIPPYEGVTPDAIARYSAVLSKLATPYSVDAAGHATPSKYLVTTLKPSAGLVTTALDIAKFDLALKQPDVVLKPETLAAAWRPPVDRTGHPLPHGIGWFVQTYNGKQIAWQYGVADGASSSMIVTLPAQNLTVVILANSDGLVKPFGLSAGDLMASPFGRVILSIFAR